MSTCQSCGTEYRLDIIVPDHLWPQIKASRGLTAGEPDVGLLCGSCIASSLEEIAGELGGVVRIEAGDLSERLKRLEATVKAQDALINSLIEVLENVVDSL